MSKEKTIMDPSEFPFLETQRIYDAETEKHLERENILRHYFGIIQKQPTNRMQRYDGR